MCGITGCLSFSTQEAKLQSQLDSAVEKLRHRGPDSQGKIITDSFAFGHTRLAIIDLSEGGHQPMVAADGKSCLIYNGECYNYRDLRQSLQNQGIVFSSDSDTEVLLNLLIQKGISGLNEVNGFFAIGFYNIQKEELLLARDRFGIKPLYYCVDKNRVIFASEMKSLLSFEPSLSLNEVALNAYLHLNYIPSPHTIFKEVKKLLPGKALIISKNGQIREESYFDLEEIPNKTPSDKSLQHFQEKLQTSVKRRLLADVPVGCFLSGGLDSSVIAGIASAENPKLKTFTMGFSDQPHFDERRYAQMVAKHFQTDHHEFLISSQDLLNTIPEILEGVDDPFADSSSIAFNSLCKFASPHIKVALSGDGGDELLGGYYKHRAFEIILNHPYLSKIAAISHPFLGILPQSRSNKWMNRFRKMARFVEAASQPKTELYYYLAGFQNEDSGLIKRSLWMDQKSMSQNLHIRSLRSIEDVLLQDLRMVLEGDMLVKTDRYSMAHGLEVRVPFLDHEVVAAGLALPLKMKSSATKGKLALRTAFGKMLPAEILLRPKQGFEVPLKSWLQGELSQLRMELTKTDFIADQGLFNAEKVASWNRRLKKQDSEGAEQVLWNLMVFNQWYQNHHHLFRS